MNPELRKEIDEVFELVKGLPENLQLRAMEILLQDFVVRSPVRGGKQTIGDPPSDSNPPLQHQANQREGVQGMILPMRLKAFLKKNNISLNSLDSRFHVEGGQVIPIWTLDTHRVATAQIQIALLLALQRALTAGEFAFDCHEVRELCKTKKAYDGDNFAGNFRRNARLFANLDSEGLVQLSDEGMNELARLIQASTPAK